MPAITPRTLEITEDVVDAIADSEGSMHPCRSTRGVDSHGRLANKEGEFRNLGDIAEISLDALKSAILGAPFLEQDSECFAKRRD